MTTKCIMKHEILQELAFPMEGESDGNELFFRASTLPSSKPLNVFLFNTYFNSFSISRWHDFAGINSVGLHLEGTGNAVLQIYIETEVGVCSTLFADEISLDGGFDTDPLDITTQKGIICVKLFIKPASKLAFALPEHSLTQMKLSGYFWTPQRPQREVSLATAITTFKRESYIKKFASMFSSHGLRTLPGGGEISVLIVDNGQSLDPKQFADVEGITIIPNQNSGGAGGFSRGMAEALQKTETTHILLMDDDIEIHPESLKRAVRFMRYAEDPMLCLGGAMLDSARRNVMYEQGANMQGVRPLPLQHKKNLTKFSELWDTFRYEVVDYYGWWFFLMPREVCEKVGFAIPVFFRGDDINYGQRIKEKKIPSANLNGVCVWHEVFEYKDNPMQAYYDTRNHLFINTALTPDKLFSEKAIAKVFWERFSIAVRQHRYRRAECMLQAAEDFFKGPEILLDGSAEERHKTLLANSEEKITELPHAEFNEAAYNDRAKYKPRLYEHILSWCTFNGLFLPDIFFKNHKQCATGRGIAYLPLNRRRLAASFRSQKIVYADPVSRYGFSVLVDKKRGRKLVKDGWEMQNKIKKMYRETVSQYRAELCNLTNGACWGLDDSHIEDKSVTRALI